MPLISILVPVCNVEKYLEKCLDSILNQTFSDIEIICMDDGSIDTSGDILDRYAEKDERVRVIHKENSGYGSTMNQAIQLATGDYIGIVESDDYIAEDMYQVLYEVATKSNLDFVKSDFYQLWNNADGSDYIEYKRLSDDDTLYNRVICPNDEKNAYFMEKFTWNALYKRKFLIENCVSYNETPGASYQDNGFWFQTFYYAKRVMFLNQAFYYYKQDNPNSSVNSNKKIFCMKDEYDFIHNFLTEKKEQDRELYKICSCFRMRGYFYTLSMLADELKQKLAIVIRDEYLYYKSLDEIDLQMFSQGEIMLLQEIIDSPQEYVYKEVKKLQHIRSITHGYKHIVIYGAGAYGKSVYYSIVRNVSKDAIIEFAVSNIKDCGSWRGKAIRCIDEFVDKKDDTLVIIAVKKPSNAYNDMMQNVQEKGFINVCVSADILI